MSKTETTETPEKDLDSGESLGSFVEASASGKIKV